MAKRSEASRLVEAFRKRKRLSMLDLSLRSGLSMNYVRNVERSLRSLGAEAADRLADKLDLSPDDRHSLFRAVGEDLVPASVREALTCPVPGLVLWKHLPELLWPLRHGQAAPMYIGMDQIVVDVVQSASPILAWVWLCEHPPDKRQTRHLCERAEEAKHTEISTAPRLTMGTTGEPAHEFAALLALPLFWQELLFDSRRSAESVVKLLNGWEYHPRPEPQRPDTLSFSFKNAEFQQVWGINAIAAGEIAGLHNLLLLSELFAIVADAGLNLGSPTAATWPGANRVKKLFDWIAGLTEEKLRRSLPARNTPPPPPLHRLVPKRNQYRARLHRARFAVRIFERPYAAGMIFGADRVPQKATVAAKCELLDRALQATNELIRDLEARRQQETEAHLRRAGPTPDPLNPVP